MLFDTLEYVFFFSLIVSIYFAIPFTWRWLLLLIGSYYFYMSWNIAYVFLIATTTLVNFFAASQIAKPGAKSSEKKFYLWLGVLVSLGILFVFKYYGLFVQTVNYAGSWFSGSPLLSVPQLLLPVGISFYTFQTLSYTIDVYRGDFSAEHSAGHFALYVSFFPQLVAGPIERPANLLPQLKQKQVFDKTRFYGGVYLIIYGLFKKLVVADRLGVFVNNVYQDPSQYNSAVFLLASIFFVIQIYCDFSAYSDIAIGSAQILGIRLMQNFDQPYLATSIRQFWQKWHISLSTWFRDYLYFSLGGNKVSRWRVYLNLFIVFTVSGLWHGANYTFIIWGMLTGAAMVGEKIIGNFLARFNFYNQKIRHHALTTVIKILLVFSFWALSMVFFRANETSDAFYIIRHLFDFSDGLWNWASIFEVGLNGYEIILGIGAYFLAEFIYFSNKGDKIRHIFGHRSVFWQWLVQILMLLSILLFNAGQASDFIYFQF